MIWHSESALPASARMLTVLALQHSYSEGDGTFLLEYFGKAKALADLLIARHAASLKFGSDDPRYGIPQGGDDALHQRTVQMETPIQQHEVQPMHWYAAAAELYRACTEIGTVWSAIGKSKQRADVAAHGAELLALAPQVYKQLHASLNKTTSNGCMPLTAEKTELPTPSFRGYAELLFSGALTAQQAAEVYTAASSSSCGPRLLVLGSPALDGAAISTPTAYGLAYGLLQHDMVEKFLLHFFT